jgi:hypothetical protein
MVRHLEMNPMLGAKAKLRDDEIPSSVIVLTQNSQYWEREEEGVV